MEREEAIRRIKAWNLDSDDMEVLSVAIPELRESEDEKIREFLIEILSQGTWRKEWPFSPNEVVAYLERQNHIQSDTEKEYVRTLKSLIFNFLRGKDEVDRDYYQRIEDWLDGRHIEQKEQESTNVLEDAFKYYTDRGITISCGDFKAEPKKEQKPTEWSEEDEGELQNAIDALEFLGKKGVYKSESGYDAALQAASWLKSIPERFNLQPKQEWSEEDEDMLNCCISSIEEAKENRYAYKETDGDTSYDREIDWLKSLRSQPRAKTNDYITPHKKFFKWIYNRLIDVHGENPNVDYMQSFKKRIDNLQFDEPRWKPSEEQIGALNYAYCELFKREDVGHNILGPLQELLDNLKKLI